MYPHVRVKRPNHRRKPATGRLERPRGRPASSHRVMPAAVEALQRPHRRWIRPRARCKPPHGRWKRSHGRGECPHRGLGCAAGSQEREAGRWQERRAPVDALARPVDVPCGRGKRPHAGFRFSISSRICIPASVWTTSAGRDVHARRTRELRPGTNLARHPDPRGRRCRFLCGGCVLLGRHSTRVPTPPCSSSKPAGGGARGVPRRSRLRRVTGPRRG